MKYTTEIVINLPIDRVIELFDNPDNLKRWQPNLVDFVHVSGTPGQPGAVSKLIYQRGKQRNELTETILVRNLPAEFSGTYEMKGTVCTIRNYFTAVDAATTRQVSENEWKFKGFMIKLIATLMPGAFKKQSQQYMKYFKEFAEKQG